MQPSDNEEQERKSSNNLSEGSLPEKTQDKLSEAETETSTSMYIFLRDIYVVSHKG